MSAHCPSAIEAERAILCTPDGLALLREVESHPTLTAAQLTRLRHAHPRPLVEAALRIVECRRRAAQKFTQANALWLDAVGLEQATSEPVARHKARRFAEARDNLVFDICAGLGGDTIALAAANNIIAVDASHARCVRAHWNCGVYGVAERVLFVQSRAEAFPVAQGSLIHIDPDRRAVRRGAGRRVHRVADYSPNPDALRRMMQAADGGAIKLGPASDFSRLFVGHQHELEIISRDGECKEATVWFGALRSCRRRATSLPSGATWTDEDAMSDDDVPIAPVMSRIFEPDAALVRAGLANAFARSLGLCRVGRGVDWFTSDQRADSPFLTCFDVLNDLPFDVGRLKSYVKAHGIGALEIKVRGLGITPEQIRQQLKPRGSAAATFMIYKCQGREPAHALHVARSNPR